MSETPGVSVVIATYNRAKLLPETIDSVLEQRFKNFELIVVDDGSTDNTRTLLESYRSRINYLYQENRRSFDSAKSGSPSRASTMDCVSGF
jgi:glycosyltransferase involved in cell wall biosynthesis